MRTILKILVALLLLPVFTGAQEVEEGMINVGKDEKPGFIATSRYDHDLVFNALATKLNNQGLTNYTIKKKFYTIKDVLIPELSPNKIDLYFKVAKVKSRTKIFFVVSKGYDNYVTTASEPTLAAGVTSFLKQIDGIVEHNLEVSKKEEEMKAANAKVEAEKERVRKAEEEKSIKAKELEDLKQKKD
jgi:hypothetical protein